MFVFAEDPHVSKLYIALVEPFSQEWDGPRGCLETLAAGLTGEAGDAQ